MNQKNYFKKIVLTLSLLIVCTWFANAQLPSNVPTNGLVGYWPFNGNANDESGNGNNGTVSGAMITTDRNGVANSAYSFNGSNQKITVLDHNSLSFTNAVFTTAYWVNIKTPITNGAPIICKYGITKDFEYGNFIYSSSSGITFGTWNLGGTCNINGNGLANSTSYQNNWHQIISVHDGLNGARLYIDGVLISSSNTSNGSCSMGNGTGNLYFGFGGGWNQQVYFNGIIDDIGIWNRALTEQEVKNLYNSTNTNECLTMVINTGVLSTNPTTYSSSISIYPNPANDQITIDCGNLTNVIGWKIKVTNTLGQEVFNAPMNTQQYVVPLNTWTGQGMYFVKIINANNEVVNIKKIILK